MREGSELKAASLGASGLGVACWDEPLLLVMVAMVVVAVCVEFELLVEVGRRPVQM